MTELERMSKHIADDVAKVESQPLNETRGEKKAAAERTKNALSILRKLHKAVAMGDIDDICDKIEKSTLKGDIDDKQQATLKTACDRREKLIRSKEENPPETEPTKEEEQSVEATDEASIPNKKKEMSEKHKEGKDYVEILGDTQYEMVESMEIELRKLGLFVYNISDGDTLQNVVVSKVKMSKQDLEDIQYMGENKR